MVIKMGGEVDEEPVRSKRPITKDLDRVIGSKCLVRKARESGLEVGERCVDLAKQHRTGDIGLRKLRLAVADVPALPERRTNEVANVPAEMEAKIASRIRD